MTDWILQHPAADKSASGGDATTIGTAIHYLGLLMERLLRRDGGHFFVEIDRQGGLSLDGKLPLSLTVINEVGGYYNTWEWIYNLASSSEVPHLFPEMLIKAKNGKLIITADPSFDHLKNSADRYDRVEQLWAEDKNTAVAKRATAPVIQSGLKI